MPDTSQQLEERPRRRSLTFWLSAWLPVALGIFVIAFESTDLMASDNTSHPLRLLFESIFGPVSVAQWDFIHHVIRKCGHFIGYGLIGLTWLRAWWMSLPHSRLLHDAFLGLLGTALVASADEWHQTFLPDRTGSPWDVLLDCSGAIALQLVVYVFLRLVRPKRLVHTED